MSNVNRPFVKVILLTDVFDGGKKVNVLVGENKINADNMADHEKAYRKPRVRYLENEAVS